MASGRKRTFFLDTPDVSYRGFSRGRRKAGEDDKPAPVKIICAGGQMFDSPKSVAIEPKHEMAVRLRRNAPASERAIRDGMAALGFSHSVPVLGYIADFYHSRLLLVVEIDGPCHKTRKAHDRKRNNVMMIHGIKTYRFSADRAYCDAAGVIADVRLIVERQAALNGRAE